MTENELRQASHVLAWVCERLKALPQPGPKALQAHASCRQADTVVKAFAEQLGRLGELDEASCAAVVDRLRLKGLAPGDAAPGQGEPAGRPATAGASPAGSPGRRRSS